MRLIVELLRALVALVTSGLPARLLRWRERRRIDKAIARGDENEVNRILDDRL